MNTAAREVITALNLQPLPGEGGYFRQTWRNASASAIYFLMTPDGFSAWHRIAQDELWHFHAGDPVEHVQLDPSGSLQSAVMGPAILAGDSPQVAVPAGVWQGARLATAHAGAARTSAHGFALLSCTVAPPWDERGFELGRRDELLVKFPAHAAWIRGLTR